MRDDDLPNDTAGGLELVAFSNTKDSSADGDGDWVTSQSDGTTDTLN